MKFLSKIREIGQQEKLKAAGLIKVLGENPLGRQIIHRTMEHEWYRHIEKAMKGRATTSDSCHWQKMEREFRKNIVGEPSVETTELLYWLQEFMLRVSNNSIAEKDIEFWLPKFRAYIEDCEKSAVDLYIAKNKLVEGVQ